MPKNLNMTTLVADVGGTNTRIALAQDGTIDRTAIQRYANRDFDSLHAVIQRYCDASSAGQITAACVAIACIVARGTKVILVTMAISVALWSVFTFTTAAAR